MPEPAIKKKKNEPVQLTERQQLALAMKESQDAAGLSSSDDEPTSTTRGKKEGPPVDDSEDEDGAPTKETEFSDDDDDDSGGAPGMVSELETAKRWWEGSAGFDFASARNKQNEEDGMRTAGDPGGWVGSPL